MDVLRSLLGFAVALTAPALAQTRYVDAANGDDSNGGTSWSDAWRTISHAAASWGGSIEIAPGLYDQALGEVFPIPAGNRAFRGVAGPAETIVDAGGVAVLVEGGLWGEPTIEGLWLRNAGTGIYVYAWCWMEWCVTELNVRDVVLSDFGTGIYAFSWTDWYDAEIRVRLDRVVVERCGTGVYVESECDPNHPTYPAFGYGHLECRDALFRDNGTGFVGFAGGNADVYPGFDRCTFTGHTGTAMVNVGTWWDPATIGIGNSIVWFNGGDFGAPANVRYSNIEHSLWPGEGNISADPLFHDPTAGDHRLRFGSPSVDAGDPNVLSGLDVGRIARPIDGDLNARERIDMGAHELAPLALRGVPAIGSKVRLELWGPAGGAATLFYRWGLPGDPVQTPWGQWDLGVAAAKVAFPDASTAPGPPFLLPLRIPADPGLVGQSLALQAASTSGLAWPPAAFTNALVLTFVP